MEPFFGLYFVVYCSIHDSISYNVLGYHSIASIVGG